MDKGRKETVGLWRNLKVQGVHTGSEIQFGCTGSLMGSCSGIIFGHFLRLQRFKLILENNLIVNICHIF